MLSRLLIVNDYKRIDSHGIAMKSLFGMFISPLDLFGRSGRADLQDLIISLVSNVLHTRAL